MERWPFAFGIALSNIPMSSSHLPTRTGHNPTKYLTPGRHPCMPGAQNAHAGHTHPRDSLISGSGSKRARAAVLTHTSCSVKELRKGMLSTGAAIALRSWLRGTDELALLGVPVPFEAITAHLRQGQGDGRSQVRRHCTCGGRLPTKTRLVRATSGHGLDPGAEP